MEKKFITQTYDKFNQKTITNSNPELVKLGTVGTLKFKIGIRHVKTPDFETLVFDVVLNSKDWLFIRHGKIILSLNNIDTITTEASENYSKVLGYQGDVDLGLVESAFYKISKDELERICNSNTLEIRVYGDSYVDFSGKNLDNFKLMCQQFYNNYYDETKYLDSINQTVSKPGGCFIATATMGDYNPPLVIDLRQFRDNWLLKRNWGISFTNWYYKYGAMAAKVIEKSIVLRKICFFLIVKPLQYLTKKIK